MEKLKDQVEQLKPTQEMIDMLNKRLEILSRSSFGGGQFQLNLPTCIRDFPVDSKGCYHKPFTSEWCIKIYPNGISDSNGKDASGRQTIGALRSSLPPQAALSRRRLSMCACSWTQSLSTLA